MSVRYLREDLFDYVVGRVRWDTSGLSAGVQIEGQIIPASAIIIGCDVAILTAFNGTVTTFDVGHVGNANAGAVLADITPGTVGVYAGDVFRSGGEATSGLTAARALTVRIVGTSITAGEAQVIIRYMRGVEVTA